MSRMPVMVGRMMDRKSKKGERVKAAIGLRRIRLCIIAKLFGIHIVLLYKFYLDRMELS